MRNETANVLLEIGIPAGVKGFTYICEAMELFDTDPYYQDGKICSLYADIAKIHETTATRVERAIRHAFDAAFNRGNPEMVERYLDAVDRKNSNLMRTLYIRMKQMKKREETKEGCAVGETCGSFDGPEGMRCTPSECALKQQFYAEAMERFSADLEEILGKVFAGAEEECAKEYIQLGCHRGTDRKGAPNHARC